MKRERNTGNTGNTGNTAAAADQKKTAILGQYGIPAGREGAPRLEAPTSGVERYADYAALAWMIRYYYSNKE